MGHEQNEKTPLNRRDFFKAAGAGVAAATVLMTPRDAAAAQAAAEKNALERIASNSYPIRPLFKTRGNPGGGGGRAGAGAAVPGDSTGSPAVAGRGGAQRARWRQWRGNCRAARRRGPWCRRTGSAAARSEPERGQAAGRGGGGNRRPRQSPQHPADEGEVRRDHHAGLPAVHQGHVPGRDADGPLLGAVRRRDRRRMFIPVPTAGRAASIR